MRVSVSNPTSSLEHVVGKIVDTIDAAIERRPWTNEKIEKHFARRSPAQIMEEGNTCYMGPCLDLTLVARLHLAQQGYASTLIVDEFFSARYGQFAVHFALEIPSVKGVHMLDFATRNKIIFREGSYANELEPPKDQIVLRFNDSINPYFSFFNSSAHMPHLKRYAWNSHLTRLKNDNTQETYQRYKASLPRGGHFELVPCLAK